MEVASGRGEPSGAGDELQGGRSASWRRVDGAYDALDRRIRQTGNVMSNGIWVLTEDLKFASDPGWFGRPVAVLNATNNALVRSCVRGVDLTGTEAGAGGVGGLLWVGVNSGPASGTHFVAYDGYGNVCQLLSAFTGTETAPYKYGPFGEPLRTTGPAAPFNPFHFSIKQTDTATGLALCEYRTYSTGSRRWLSRDPEEEGVAWNSHGFLRIATLSDYDPLGLTSCAIHCCCGATASIPHEGGWCGALKRLKDRYPGRLASKEVFGPASPHTQNVAESEVAARLRRTFLGKNRGKPCPDRRPLTGAGPVGRLKEFFCERGNGSARFVGGADGDVYIMGYGCSGAVGNIGLEYRNRNPTSPEAPLYQSIRESCDPTAPGLQCSNHMNEEFWCEMHECIFCFGP